MKRDKPAPLEIDYRLRAALLWDRPTLLGLDDPGSRQWRDALHMDFVNFGEVVAGDTLSLAAHTFFAAVSGDAVRASEMREALRADGAVGELIERLLGLALVLDSPPHDAVALPAAHSLVRQITDTDLRARLLVRLINFAELRGFRDASSQLADEALNDTDPTTRLGVVARRWASQFGIDVPNFNPWVTDTPEDPLIALPWVLRSVVDASAAIATEQFEQRLAGVSDTSFHVGRTKVDDLHAAHVQAGWCGALDLRSNIRKLLSTHVLATGAHTTEQVRWALLVWASEPSAKRVSTVIRQAERNLDALTAAELLAAVRRETRNDDAVVDVAAGVWELLDDGAADDLLAWLPDVGTERSATRRDNVLRALLWRRPATWAQAFAAADAAKRTRMLAALDPHDLTAAPSDLRELFATHAIEITPDQLPTALLVALRFVKSGDPLDHVEPITALDAVQVLEWDRDAIDPTAIEELVHELTSSAQTRLEEAREGKVGFGAADTGRLLGQIASYLPERNSDAVDALITTAADPNSPASWQFGALDGLAVLRSDRKLEDEDVKRVRALDLTPGPEMFGEAMTAAALRAAQLRILAPAVTDDEVAWLAVSGRGSDVQARLISMVALGAIPGAAPVTVDWSLVGGLFDPHDDVVIRAVGSIGLRGLTAASGAATVARNRLRDLGTGASILVRREVTVTAVKRRELDLADVIERSRGDRAWSVRREAEEGVRNEDRGVAPGPNG